jgi:hypothetical protein
MMTMNSKANFGNGAEGFHDLGADPSWGKTQGKSPTSGLTAQPELAPDSLVGADAAPNLAPPVQVDEATFRALGVADRNNSFAIKVPSVAAASPDAPRPVNEQLDAKIAKTPMALKAPIQEHTPTGN